MDANGNGYFLMQLAEDEKYESIFDKNVLTDVNMLLQSFCIVTHKNYSASASAFLILFLIFAHF